MFRPLWTEILISKHNFNQKTGYKSRPPPNSGASLSHDHILIENILYDSPHVIYYIYMAHELDS